MVCLAAAAPACTSYGDNAGQGRAEATNIDAISSEATAFPLPTAPPDQVGFELALTAGTLDRVSNCLVLKASGRVAPIVWPAGTSTADALTIHLPDGDTLSVGQPVILGGGSSAAAQTSTGGSAAVACVEATGARNIFVFSGEIG